MASLAEQLFFSLNAGDKGLPWLASNPVRVSLTLPRVGCASNFTSIEVDPTQIEDMTDDMIYTILCIINR